MIIDKKRETVFANCLQRKKKNDKLLALTKGALMLPPMLFGAFMLIEMGMSLFRGALYTVSGASLQGAIDNGPNILWLINLIICAALIISSACLTVYETEFVIKHYIAIYVCITIAAIIMLLLSGAFNSIYTDNTRSPIIVVYRLFEFFFIPFYSLASIFFAWQSRKCVLYDMELRKLDGYPHFNPSLMHSTERAKEKISKEELEEMDDYERIMLERDGRL
ncbi:MAG: hypothetical protein IJ385_04700 [Ruminiclostridium sp.]|nr:hypothetical protein [Ruminiclostridium sp.]